MREGKRGGVWEKTEKDKKCNGITQQQRKEKKEAKKKNQN